MTLRNDDKEWIRAEIGTSLDALRPHGWARAANVLREFGTIAAIIGVFMALVSITLGSLYFALGRVDRQARFETNTTNSLTEIDTHLKTIDRQLAKQNLEAVASLAPTEFRASLPDLSASIAAARQQAVLAPSSTIGSIQQKLIATPDGTPGYWPATAQFVSYRSNQVGTLQTALGSCEHGPGPYRVTGGPAAADMMVEVTFSNCTLDLNRPSFWTTNTSNLGHIQTENGVTISKWHLKLHDVIVRYSGGPLVNVNEITFDHCIFDFQFSQPPASSPGRSLTVQLLASSASDTVSIRLPSV